MMNRIDTFTADQINTLRAEFAGINTVNADRLSDFHKIFDGCSDDALKQLTGASIKFVSSLAINAARRRGVK